MSWVRLETVYILSLNSEELFEIKTRKIRAFNTNKHYRSVTQSRLKLSMSVQCTTFTLNNTQWGVKNCYTFAHVQKTNEVTCIKSSTKIGHNLLSRCGDLKLGIHQVCHVLGGTLSKST